MAARGERGTVRTVTLDRIQGLAHAVLHDVQHVDADSEAGAGAACLLSHRPLISQDIYSYLTI